MEEHRRLRRAVRSDRTAQAEPLGGVARDRVGQDAPDAGARPGAEQRLAALQAMLEAQGKRP